MNNSLSDISYLELINCSSVIWDNLEFESLSLKKVNGLIENELLELNNFNIEKLKNSFSNLHIKLIEINLDDFMKNLEDFELFNEDILELLKSEKIIAKDKFVIFEKHIDNELLVNQKETETVDIISNLIITKFYDKLDQRILITLIGRSKEIQVKVNLLNIYFNDICENLANVNLFINLLPKSYKQLLIKRKRPTLENNYFNLKLVKNLKGKNLISSFEINEDKINIVANY